MKTFAASFKERLRMVDPVILGCITAISVLSLSVIYNLSDYIGNDKFYVQLLANVLGVVIMLIINTLDYQLITEKFKLYFFIFSAAFLMLTLIIGTGDGNTSWIKIPGSDSMTIQPSEFVKASYILTFSFHMYKVKDDINHPRSVAGLAVHAGIIIGLIVISKDIGVALVYIGFTLIMLFAAGLSLWYFIGGGIAAALMAPHIMPLLTETQQARIIYGFYPERDPLGKGYQALLSRKTISAGGMFGRGISGGSVFAPLPQKHSDFVFAVLCEKLGFIGGFIYIVLIAVLIIRIIYISRISRKDYGSYICIGVAAVLIVQVLENIGMCLALLPVVGITLPFMSYGGTSTMAVFILMGMVQSVRSHKVKYFFEREKS